MSVHNFSSPYLLFKLLMAKSLIIKLYALISLLTVSNCVSLAHTLLLGKAERIICTLNDCVRSLLLHVGMPDSYWVEALSTVTHLLNRRPCQTTGALTAIARCTTVL